LRVRPVLFCYDFEKISKMAFLPFWIVGGKLLNLFNA
jgi:hypothetical protein